MIITKLFFFVLFLFLASFCFYFLFCFVVNENAAVNWNLPLIYAGIALLQQANVKIVKQETFQTLGSSKMVLVATNLLLKENVPSPRLSQNTTSCYRYDMKFETQQPA